MLSKSRTNVERKTDYQQSSRISALLTLSKLSFYTIKERELVRIGSKINYTNTANRYPYY